LFSSDDETMGIIEILAGLFRGKPGKDGIWDYLGKRAEAKSRVELEKVRNQGSQEAIQSLTPGMVLREGGPDWFREIRAPGAAVPSEPFTTAVPASPMTPLPLSAPRNELEPAPQQAQGLVDDP
jgi:hypothetical protein